MAQPPRRWVALLAFAGFASFACDDDTGPAQHVVDLSFGTAIFELGPDASGAIRLTNRGSDPEGPIQLIAGSVTRDGAAAATARLDVDPAEISALEPGDSASVSLILEFDAEPAPGQYEATLEARLAGEPVTTLQVRLRVAEPPGGGESRTLSISGGPVAPLQGDVVTYQAETRDSNGSVIADPTLSWSVQPAGSGLILGDGRFVGYEPGAARIVATASGLADTLEIQISARGLSGSFSVVGSGDVSARYTSDLWVHGDYAYTGTWGCRAGLCGDRLYAWNVAAPGSPALTDSIIVDATVVNDVKIRADGLIGVISHEGSSDGLNGVSILDLGDPAHPSVIKRYTSGLETGVHNVWIEGDYVYAAVDGARGLRILDISTPSSPTTASSYYAGSSFLHDVYVRDGLAFLSHWDAGLVILDVGNGIANGSPVSPVEVSRIQTAGGQVHNAWYWPETAYVFVGEENFGTPGVMHVVDASVLTDPREVATFRVAGSTPHNFWLDEQRAILYVGWYTNGVRAIDVSGELLGELDRQGREIAAIQYGVGTGCQVADATCTWAPQLHGGLVFASDMNSGLWVLEPDF